MEKNNFDKTDFENIANRIKEAMKSPNKKDDELVEWLSRQPKDVMTNLSSAQYFTNTVEELEKKNSSVNKVQLLNKIDKYEALRRKKHLLKIYVSAVSIAAAVIAISFMVYNTSEKNNIEVSQNIMPKQVKKIEITKPQLVVGDKIIELNDSCKTDITKYRKLSVEEKNQKDIEHKVIIPKGSTHSIVLEDGSEIILNAMSELSYKSFNGKDVREVTLKGEAFFKVTKNNKPFIVNTLGGCSVKVYGTEFNVNAYTNSIKTVLVTGSVGVKAEGSKEVKISPNQMALVNVETKECKVYEVNASDYTSWVNGEMAFYGENISNVISEIERWYNITIDYNKENLKNINISLITNRNKSVDNVLSLIESISDVVFIKDNKEGGHYSIEKR